jgi:hypothetical protein
VQPTYLRWNELLRPRWPRQVWYFPGNPYSGGKLSTVDLLVLTSLDQLLLIMQTLFQDYPYHCRSLKQWNSTFFEFPLIIDGTTEKVLQFTIPLKSIYNQNLGFVEQKMYFWTLQRGLLRKSVNSDRKKFHRIDPWHWENKEDGSYL